MKSVSHSFHLLQWGLRCHIGGGQVSCVDVQEETILAATDLARVGWVHVEEVQLKKVVDDGHELYSFANLWAHRWWSPSAVLDPLP